MPFKSDKQRKACFATDGFGGEVDCEEWAKKTKDKKSKKKGKKKFSEWLEKREQKQSRVVESGGLVDPHYPIWGREKEWIIYGSNIKQ